jgi:FMN-dependent NADH-azoreductase
MGLRQGRRRKRDERGRDGRVESHPALVARFKRAGRIVLGVPIWNFAYPYKLKQLIDLVSQRSMLFTYDGGRFGPLLETPRAMVIYTRVQEYKEDLPTPPCSTTNQALSSSGSISSGCQTFEHWRLRTRGAIKQRPACEQRKRKWQLSPMNSD